MEPAISTFFPPNTVLISHFGIFKNKPPKQLVDLVRILPVENIRLARSSRCVVTTAEPTLQALSFSSRIDFQELIYIHIGQECEEMIQLCNAINFQPRPLQISIDLGFAQSQTMFTAGKMFKSINHRCRLARDHIFKSDRKLRCAARK